MQVEQKRKKNVPSVNPSAGETNRLAKTEKVPDTGMYDAISPLFRRCVQDRDVRSCVLHRSGEGEKVATTKVFPPVQRSESTSEQVRSGGERRGEVRN